VIVSILGAFLVTPFYSPHGKVSVRRKVGTDIKCDMIARKLNGRGHSYAAAGIIKSHSELLKVPRVIKNCKLFYEIHN